MINPIIYTNHNHSNEGSAIVWLSIFISVELIMLSVYLTRAIIWLLNKKHEYTFYEYVIWDDWEGVVSQLNTICFIVINIIAIVVLLTFLILNILTK